MTTPTYYEKVLNTQSTTKKVTKNYLVNAASGTAAMQQLWTNLPAQCAENTSLLLTPDQCSSVEFSYKSGSGSNTMGVVGYDCTMVWADPSWSGTAGSFSISFDVSGATQHITQSYETVESYSPDSSDDDPPDFGGAIGVNQDHSVSGCDITIPALAVVYNCNFSPSVITESYIAAAGNCVGKVASSAMFGFDQGELMLTRVSGQRQSGELWSVSFAFSVMRNRTNFTVGSGDSQVTVDNKQGWDYLWVYYQPGDNQDDSGDGGGSGSGDYAVRPQLKGVYIERVFDTADYSVLGISSLQIAGG
jgi:hypothetical protein